MKEIKMEYINDVREHLEGLKEIEKRSIWAKLDKVFGVFIIACGLFSVFSGGFTIMIVGVLFIIAGINSFLNIFHMSHLIVKIRFRRDKKNFEKQ